MIPKIVGEESYADEEDFHYNEEDLKDFKVLPVWNILPSYEMYSNSFFGVTGPEPPGYDGEAGAMTLEKEEAPSMSDALGSSVSGSTTASIANTSHLHSSRSSIPTPEDPDATVTFDDARDNSWQSSVLDNVHKLNNMTDTDNKCSSAVNMKVAFTKEVCKFGEVPEIIDPSNFEYKQGDYINGYITIQNTSDFKIDFKMLYVLFEGTITTSKIKKNFLQMYDFSGSFSKNSYVRRLVTDVQNSKICPMAVDYDGAHLGFGTNKIEPKRLYKRFFSFRIPESLLDNECPSYTLSSHVRLPPSMGNTKDFSHLNSKIEYNVLCRFIGKARDYEFNPNKNNAYVFNESGDEYVILKEGKSPVRIIEQTPADPQNLELYQDLVFENLVKSVDEKIILGRELISAKKQGQTEIEQVVESLEQEVLRERCRKQNQLYVRTQDCKNSKMKEIEIVVKPKSTLLKKSGPLKVSTPQKVYQIPYISPKIHRTTPLPNLNLSVPFTFSTTSVNPPILKAINVDLVCLTLQSDAPIPVEFNHGLIFKNSDPLGTMFTDKDDARHNIMNVFKDKYEDIKDICKTVKIQDLKIEKRLLDDIKCLATLQQKVINLSVFEPKISDGICEIDVPSWNKVDNTFHTKFDLQLDLNNLSTKGPRQSDPFDNFTLVPDFQSCNITRIYYFKVFFQFSNHSALVKIPVSIVHSV